MKHAYFSIAFLTLSTLTLCMKQKPTIEIAKAQKMIQEFSTISHINNTTRTNCYFAGPNRHIELADGTIVTSSHTHVTVGNKQYPYDGKSFVAFYNGKPHIDD